jgi:hypothetical protein
MDRMIILSRVKSIVATAMDILLANFMGNVTELENMLEKIDENLASIRRLYGS